MSGEAEAGGRRVGVGPAPAAPAPPLRAGGRGLGPAAGHHLPPSPPLGHLAGHLAQPGHGAGLADVVPAGLARPLLPRLRVLLERLQLGQGDDVAAARLVPHCLLTAGIVVVEPEQICHYIILCN